MNLPSKNNLIRLFIAIDIALIVLAVYYFSGQGSADQNTRKLQQSPQVDQVKLEQNDAGQKTAKIKCKDGSNYDVYIPPGSANYDALSATKCEEAPAN